MPLYEYHCKRCNYWFDELIAWAERNTIKCTKCKKPAKRIFPLPHFYMRGRDDYSDKMLREEGVID